MTGSNFGSGAELGIQCKQGMQTSDHTVSSTNPTICLLNIVDVLRNLTNIDFIALQEAANWDVIQSNLQLTHPNLKIVHSSHTVGGITAHIVTFYNINKIKILAVKSGVIGDSRSRDIRPYHILFCLDINVNKYIIFVNLHNGHEISLNTLQTNLSANINSGMLIEDNGNADYVNCQSYYNNITPIFDNFNNAYAIVCGDFNDNGNQYFKGLELFTDSLDNITQINVSSAAKTPPITCCSTVINERHHRYGDYILFTDNFIADINNEIHPINQTKIYSDHLPVQTILTYKTDDSSLNHKTFKLKQGLYSVNLLLNFNPDLNGFLVTQTDELIYPDNEFNKELILVCNNVTKQIGYVRKQYLIETSNPNINKINIKRTLRYLYNLADPNTYQSINKYLHKGFTILKSISVGGL